MHAMGRRQRKNDAIVRVQHYSQKRALRIALVFSNCRMRCGFSAALRTFLPMLRAIPFPSIILFCVFSVSAAEHVTLLSITGGYGAAQPSALGRELNNNALTQSGDQQFSNFGGELWWGNESYQIGLTFGQLSTYSLRQPADSASLMSEEFRTRIQTANGGNWSASGNFRAAYGYSPLLAGVRFFPLPFFYVGAVIGAGIRNGAFQYDMKAINTATLVSVTDSAYARFSGAALVVAAKAGVEIPLSEYLLLGAFFDTYLIVDTVDNPIPQRGGTLSANQLVLLPGIKVTYRH